MKTFTIIGLMVLMLAPAQAQNLTLKFIAEIGQHLEFDFRDTRPAFKNRMDFEGDGLPEIIVMKENDDGDVSGIRIVDPREDVVRYEMSEEELAINIGAADLDVLAVHDMGDGTRAITILKNKIVGSAFCDSMFFYSVDMGGLLGVFPPRKDAGKKLNTQIGTLSTFALVDLDGDGEMEFIAHDEEKGIVEVWSMNSTATGVDSEGVIERALSQLMQSYPNPFRAHTIIPYELAASSDASLVVYDALGREVRTLIRGRQSAGAHVATWDGRDDAGAPVAAGVYFYQLRIDDTFLATHQMIRIR